MSAAWRNGQLSSKITVPTSEERESKRKWGHTAVRPHLKEIYALGLDQYFENSPSSRVMNSSTAGSPDAVAVSPRLMAGTISSGSRIFSA